jgi:hypothetical protein
MSKKKREYFGTVLATSAYAGEKALSVSFEPEKAFELAMRLLRAVMDIVATGESRPIDLTIWWGKHRRDGMISVTVTAPLLSSSAKRRPRPKVLKAHRRSFGLPHTLMPLTVVKLATRE